MKNVNNVIIDAIKYPENHICFSGVFGYTLKLCNGYIIYLN